MSNRPKNPRRVVLPVLRDMAASMRTMISVWNQLQKTCDQETAHSEWHWRPLTDAEKVENQPEQWDRLAQYMAAIAHDADAVRVYATRQAAQLRANAASTPHDRGDHSACTRNCPDTL